MESTKKKIESIKEKVKKVADSTKQAFKTGKDRTLMDRVRAAASTSKQTQEMREPSTSHEKQTHESIDGRIGLREFNCISIVVTSFCTFCSQKY